MVFEYVEHIELSEKAQYLIHLIMFRLYNPIIRSSDTYDWIRYTQTIGWTNKVDVDIDLHSAWLELLDAELMNSDPNDGWSYYTYRITDKAKVMIDQFAAIKGKHAFDHLMPEEFKRELKKEE